MSSRHTPSLPLPSGTGLTTGQTCLTNWLAFLNLANLILSMEPCESFQVVSMKFRMSWAGEILFVVAELCRSVSDTAQLTNIANAILPHLLKVIVQADIFSVHTRARAVHIYNIHLETFFSHSLSYPVSPAWCVGRCCHSMCPTCRKVSNWYSHLYKITCLHLLTFLVVSMLRTWIMA